MPKVDFRLLSKKKIVALDREFWSALERCESKMQLVQFLRHFITGSEFVMLARRFQIAKLLLAGHSQWGIRHKLGVGLTTIQSVDRWLRHSPYDYSKVLPPLLYEARQKRLAGASVPDALEPVVSAFRKLHPVHYEIIKLLIEGWGDTEEMPIEVKCRKYKKSS